MDHRPEGFQSVTPYLLLEDPRGFIDFAKRALGATERFVHEEGGRFVHGELTLHGCVLELGQLPAASAPTQSAFHVFVEDPDGACARAIAEGATSLYEVTDHDYGERSGGVSDDWGNHWYFAAVIDHEKRAG
ncbi:MAG: VOC family protein [Gemmatimonadota bacterium]|nr:VOC family protein [Gemmatimonadota bacterium]